MSEGHMPQGLDWYLEFEPLKCFFGFLFGVKVGSLGAL